MEAHPGRGGRVGAFRGGEQFGDKGQAAIERKLNVFNGDHVDPAAGHENRLLFGFLGTCGKIPRSLNSNF